MNWIIKIYFLSNLVRLWLLVVLNLKVKNFYILMIYKKMINDDFWCKKYPKQISVFELLFYRLLVYIIV